MPLKEQLVDRYFAYITVNAEAPPPDMRLEGALSLSTPAPAPRRTSSSLLPSDSSGSIRSTSSRTESKLPKCFHRQHLSLFFGRRSDRFALERRPSQRHSDDRLRTTCRRSSSVLEEDESPLRSVHPTLSSAPFPVSCLLLSSFPVCRSTSTGNPPVRPSCRRTTRKSR